MTTSRALEVVSDFTETEYKIVQNILAHPEYLPTIPELEWILDTDSDTLRTGIDSLQNRDIVETHTTTTEADDIITEEVTFYALTEKGLEIVDEHNTFNDSGMMRHLYAKVTENSDRPDVVETLAGIDRPDKHSPQD